MKNVLLTSLTFLCSLFLFNQDAFSVNELFRSRSSGNWSSNSSWEMSTNGGGSWFNATSTPIVSSDAITIRSPHTITVTVSVSADQLSINSGGTISINAGNTLTVVDGIGNDFTLTGTISGPGTIQTQGIGFIMQIDNGSNFTTALKVNTGTTTVQTGTPSAAIFKASVLIDPGATLNTVAPNAIQGNSAVVNNGIISGSTFIVKGGSLANNNVISTFNLNLDSVTSLSGTGNYTSSNIILGIHANISLANNISFSPTVFFISTGGLLNTNTRTLTINSGTFTLSSGASVTNSGTIQTQSNVTLNIRNGSSFNAQLKVNTGITSTYDSGSPFTAVFNGAITVDAGATLAVVNGGFTLRSTGTLTNNGFVSGYVNTDLTGDMSTNLTDVVIALNNSVSFVHLIRP